MECPICLEEVDELIDGEMCDLCFEYFENEKALREDEEGHMNAYLGEEE